MYCRPTIRCEIAYSVAAECRESDNNQVDALLGKGSNVEFAVGRGDHATATSLNNSLDVANSTVDPWLESMHM